MGIIPNKTKPTRNRTLESMRTVDFGGGASDSGIELVASLSDSTAPGDTPSEAYAFATLRFEQRVRTLADPVGDGRVLFEWIRPPIREDDRGQVDLYHSRHRSSLELHVLLVEDCCSVWDVRPSVAFPGHVELGPRVFWESGKEELKERVDIFTGDVTPADPRSVVGVGPSDVHGLVEK